ncbi:unnamed protein product [Cladocopium goreaui]|uniref:Uncharacterized protein n=1 Tax=Cladocopium goreaui TaxID=2562237 RepID=A0A9P1M4T4_9DINO|nr:unnamed protein product [Cladocopium goreaui]
MAQGRSLGEELLDLHNSLQRLQPALSKAFIYMFFKQGLPIGSKLRFHRKFHADPELEAVGNGISTYALQIILPTACHEYHPAADTCGAYWEALVKVVKDGDELLRMLLSDKDDILKELWQKLHRFGHENCCCLLSFYVCLAWLVLPNLRSSDAVNLCFSQARPVFGPYVPAAAAPAPAATTRAEPDEEPECEDLAALADHMEPPPLEVEAPRWIFQPASPCFETSPPVAFPLSNRTPSCLSIVDSDDPEYLYA